MDSYLYAPKDDYKHRAYWRELYTVEETENLTSLITAAKEQGIVFYYALSPGQDMTYSSQKELQILKRKLEQVSQFGCEAFALLFDDIEPELSKLDKEMFQTFANAQVSVTNEIFTTLNNPKFLFCPTQYCSSRAVPSVVESEYLNTIGTKLHADIDIMWTGDKVISKTLTIESIQEISDVIRRPPVIWDNLHANDYDQKRVFLGPYSGRSPEIIPLLKGVLTNPNCEFHANTIAICSLAAWSKCKSETKINTEVKLETETEDGLPQEPIPSIVSENIYHPKIALKNAIKEWLTEFCIPKEAFGPISKPQPPVTMVMPILPIIPSVNTCMSLTTTTTSCSFTGNPKPSPAVPEFNTSQLQAFADVCSTVNSSSTNPVMNSLVSATKIILDDNIPNTIASIATSNIEIPKKIPISTMAVPVMKIGSTQLIQDESLDNNLDMTENSKENEPLMNVEDDELRELNDKGSLKFDDIVKTNNEHEISDENIEAMECGSSIASQTSPNNMVKTLSEDIIMSDNAKNEIVMQIEMSDEEVQELNLESDFKSVNEDDLLLFCDLFYLPFQHGNQALKVLNDFFWLKNNANVLVSRNKNDSSVKIEIQEWMQRSQKFDEYCHSVYILGKKISTCANKELCYDLFSYIWDIATALTVLNAFVKWLALGCFPENINSYTQGSFTWFSKGWKESFQSGDQEPWVFRGGLVSDLQRLMPVDGGNDLFVYKFPDSPTVEYYLMRPYNHMDEEEVYNVYQKTNQDTNILPENFKELLFDLNICPFLTLNPELAIVMHNTCNIIIGYACAVVDCKIFNRNKEICWIPNMCEKYPLEKCESSLPVFVKTTVNGFHNFKYECPPCVYSTYPSILSLGILKDDLIMNSSLAKQILTVLLAALRSNGSFGVHICLDDRQCGEMDFYLKLGFNEIFRDTENSTIYLGRQY
ncbi:MGEA5 family protein [Megaselia abdita]